MKRALLVGIDDYDNAGNLTGCANDVAALNPLLSRNDDGSPAFNCQARSERATRDQLLSDLDSLLSGGADVALFYFAGHGVAQDADVVLATSDGRGQTQGVAFSEVLTKVAGSPVGEVILILDCCFAGAAGAVPQLASNDSHLRQGVTIVAASRGDQTAAETSDARGAFSTYLCGALEGGAADVLGKVTVAGIYSYLDESFGPWDQRPVFKANVERLHVLRFDKPAVPLPELRQITEFFPAPDHEFLLDPSYEPDEDPKDQEHEGIFKTLQKYRAAKLLEPVGEEHMYYAALNHKSCKLTELGKLYWRLAAEDRL